MTPRTPLTFVDVLRDQADARPDRTAFTFLEGGETEADSLTYARLDHDARAIASRLQAIVRRGDRALLLYPPGLEFIRAFMGCLYAGVIAVTVYPPRRNRSIDRLRAVIHDAQAAIALTTAAVSATLGRGDGLDLGVPVCVTDRGDLPDADAWRVPALTPATLAFLQYTSGSTDSPKGVMITHRNLLHNSALINTGFSHTPESVFVSWLPLFHDMGLIGMIISPIRCGARGVLMEPAAFLQKPVRWLRAISNYRGTTSGAPNSAYELCSRRVSAQDRETLDLSSWTFAFNGAEPVRASTVRVFYDTFAPCGLRLESVQPCYGLAEATLLVSIGGLGQVPAFHTTPSGTTLVSSGRRWLDERVVIVDPDTCERRAEGETGEIWLSSDSVASGYWNRPDDTAAAFAAHLSPAHDGPFFRTGDLGFERGDQIFVTGRLKDLVIIRGRNFYPQDIEDTAGCAHPALSNDLCAAFAIPPESGDESERLVVVCEVRREQRTALNPGEVIQAVRQAVTEEHDIDPSAIVLLRPLTLPKTSSGKIQRHLCREQFLAGALTVVDEWRRRAPVALDAAPPPRRASYRDIHDWLVSRVAALTGTEPARVSAFDPFTRHGLDSQRSVMLSGELQEWLGRPLPATVTYDFPSIDALARHLAGEEDGPVTSSSSSGRATEPIAIIGIGCRFPGASTPEQFWERLTHGFDAVGAAPASRPGAATLGIAGFLDDVERFDAGFFGITPREAAVMDPQQRLLLEVAWEAIENAGIDAARLAGSRTAVMVGISNQDYLRLQSGVGRIASDPYVGTGNAFSIAANRLSYLLDLRGPSWAVDTACSSSLVAVHQACDSLRRGECDAALSGGVNLILGPDMTMAFTNAGMLSPSHRCRTFDAGADGYVRGEGAAIVLLKRLTDAERDGDTIHALILGSAVNQDGRSNGLTAPNGPAQQAVIRAALDAAGVSPLRVGYVEAHGTGTPLGDPIEMQALTSVLGEGRPASDRCAVGSVKTNIGHLESAAGIAGLIKAVLALRYAAIPASLHFASVNPHIALAGTPFFVPAVITPWPSPDGTRRLAGVSAFGFGGANAHVIVEAAPGEVRAASDERPERTAHVIALSAKSEAALRDRARDTAGFLRTHRDIPIADVAFTGNTGRSAMVWRAAVVATSTAEAITGLDLLVTNGTSPRAITAGTGAGPAPPLALLFTGQGSQYAGMARDLLDSEPVFRSAMLWFDERFRRDSHRSLLDAIYQVDGLANEPARLDDTEFTQPALFALECSLARLWASWGIVPAAVLGHSVGEYAAACVAGVFDEDDGFRLVSARARLMAALPRTGSMRVVFADRDTVRTASIPYADRVSIAAVNGPANVVISGDRVAVQAIVTALEPAGIASAALNTSHAFHSPLMAAMVAEFRAIAGTITFRPPRLPIVSNLTGRFADQGVATADYWVRHILEPVEFGAGITALHASGCRLFLEVGPQPDLIGMGRRAIPAADIVWIASLQRSRAAWDSIAAAVADLFINGAPIDWTAFDAGRGRHRVALPTYPFERQRFWIRDTAPAPQRSEVASHPLLGRRLTDTAHAPDVHTWESSLTLDRLPYLADHRLLGSAVLPYSAFVEMAFAAIDQIGGGGHHRLVDLELHHPVVLPPTDEARIQLTLDRTAAGTWRLRIHTHVSPAWTLAASALLEARTDHEIRPDVLCRQ